MSFYAEMAATSQDILTELGQSVIITGRTVGAYDPTTGQSSITRAEETGKAVIFPRSDSEIDGTLIQKGDNKLLLSPTGITEPQVGDKVLANGIRFTITSVAVTSPAGIPVLIECNLRR